MTDVDFTWRLQPQAVDWSPWRQVIRTPEVMDEAFCVPRVILTLWGAFTLVCGAFIFGQSTTITIMQILGKI